MIAKLIIFVAGFFALGAALIAFTHCTHEITRPRRRADWIKYLVFLALVAVVLFLAHTGKAVLVCMLMLILLTAAFELQMNFRNAVYCGDSIATVIVLAVAACLIHLLLFDDAVWFSSFTFVFLIVAVADSFSQLIGRLMGKHPFGPHLSPHKTAEGAVGGLLTAVLAAMVFRSLLPGYSLSDIALLGMVISLSAIIGDLIFSTIKRKLDIKDFSGILPGHGGVLDRFDSLIIAAPVFYWTHKLISPPPGGLL